MCRGDHGEPGRIQLDLARAEFARANALHDTDVRALIHLLDADRAGVPATAGWLGAQLGLTSPSTTALIDRLESRGHVRRERSARDRRKVEIRVTAEAIALGWAFFGPLLTGMVEAMRPFGADEFDTVERFLRTVAEVVRRPGHPPSGTPAVPPAPSARRRQPEAEARIME